MAAVIARLDMTAERGGAAVLDRDHRAPPLAGKRRAMLITPGRAELAEHVRQFQPFAGHGPHPSGGHEVRSGWCEIAERLQRAGRGTNRAGGDP